MAQRPMSLWAALATLVMVVAGAALALRGVELIGRAASSSLGGRAWPSVGELERTTGHRLAMPAYFPRTLRWPPAQLRTAGHRPTAAVVGLTGADGGAVQLWVVQTLDGRGELPDDLLPPATALESGPLEVSGAPARLRRLIGDDGHLWQELAWDHGDQSLLLRARTGLEQLQKMADSVRREGPE